MGDGVLLAGLLSSAVAVISLAGMIATFVWTLKNIKRSSKQDITDQAMEKANVRHALDQTSAAIKELTKKVDAVGGKIEGFVDWQRKIEKNLAIVENKVNTAFEKIDELKGK